MLTVEGVKEYLIGQCRAHITNPGVGYSTELASRDLDPSIWDGLARHGIYLDALRNIEDTDLRPIPAIEAPAFLLGCVIAIKKRVLNFYRSQATQGALGSRAEFVARANGLAADIESDEESYALARESFACSGIDGGPILTGTNIPDAVRIPYRAS